MKKYSLTSNKTGAIIIVGYRDGILVYVDMQESVNKLQAMWAHEKVPIPFSEFQNFIDYAKTQKIVVSEIEPDLTFETFYNLYDYKKGKKASAVRIWGALDDTNKSKAITYIKKYNFYLAENPNIQKKYPQTYLNAQEWNN